MQCAQLCTYCESFTLSLQFSNPACSIFSLLSIFYSHHIFDCLMTGACACTCTVTPWMSFFLMSPLFEAKISFFNIFQVHPCWKNEIFAYWTVSKYMFHTVNTGSNCQRSAQSSCHWPFNSMNKLSPQLGRQITTNFNNKENLIFLHLLLFSPSAFFYYFSFHSRFDYNKCWCLGPEPCHLVSIYFLWGEQQAHWHSITLFWHNDSLPPPVTWTTHNTVHDKCCVNQTTRTHIHRRLTESHGETLPSNTDDRTHINKQSRQR